MQTLQEPFLGMDVLSGTSGNAYTTYADLAGLAGAVVLSAQTKGVTFLLYQADGTAMDAVEVRASEDLTLPVYCSGWQAKSSLADNAGTYRIVALLVSEAS